MKPAELCECRDYGCPACEGRCQRPAVDRVTRIDWPQPATVAFCQECLEDALEAGVYGHLDDQLDPEPGPRQEPS